MSVLSGCIHGVQTPKSGGQCTAPLPTAHSARARAPTATIDDWKGVLFVLYAYRVRNTIEGLVEPAILCELGRIARVCDRLCRRGGTVAVGRGRVLVGHDTPSSDTPCYTCNHEHAQSSYEGPLLPGCSLHRLLAALHPRAVLLFGLCDIGRVLRPDERLLRGCRATTGIQSVRRHIASTLLLSVGVVAAAGRVCERIAWGERVGRVVWLLLESGEP